MTSVPEVENMPVMDEPGPREVLQALQKALQDDGRLKITPPEKIAWALLIRGYLHVKPSPSLVADMIRIMRHGGLGFRMPTLQPCALKFFWDIDESRISSIMDLSWNLEWTGAPIFGWERQAVPEKLTHTKTPPCTDLISEPEAVLGNKERWPTHLCEAEFMHQSTGLWAEVLPFVSDSMNVHRWASTYPLPIGRQALMASQRMNEAELLSEWPEGLNVLPFEEYEKAMWALRVEHRESTTVHTLDLFGLGEYPTEESKALEYPVAGALAYSVRGKGNFPTKLIDLLGAADRWWAQFRGLTFRGRLPGTGTWTSREHFVNDVKQAMAKARSDGEKVTQESIAERLHIGDRHLRERIEHFNLT